MVGREGEGCRRRKRGCLDPPAYQWEPIIESVIREPHEAQEFVPYCPSRWLNVRPLDLCRGPNVVYVLFSSTADTPSQILPLPPIPCAASGGCRGGWRAGIGLVGVWGRIEGREWGSEGGVYDKGKENGRAIQ